VKIEPGADEHKTEVVFNHSGVAQSRASVETSGTLSGSGKSIVTSVWSTPLPGVVQCKIEPMQVDFPTQHSTFSYPPLGLNLQGQFSDASSALTVCSEQKLLVPKSEPNLSFYVSNLVSSVTSSPAGSVHSQVVGDKPVDASSNVLIKAGMAALHPANEDTNLPLSSAVNTIGLQYPLVPSTLANNGMIVSSVTGIPNSAAFPKSSSKIVATSLPVTFASCSSASVDSPAFVPVFYPQSYAMAASIPHAVSAACAVTNFPSTTAPSNLTEFNLANCVADKQNFIANFNSSVTVTSVGALGFSGSNGDVPSNPLLLTDSGLLPSSMIAVSSGISSQHKMIYSAPVFSSLSGGLPISVNSAATNQALVVDSAGELIVPSSFPLSAGMTTGQHIPFDASNVSKSVMAVSNVATSLTHSAGASTVSLKLPFNNGNNFSLPSVTAASTYVHIIPPRVPTPEVPRSPVSLLDLRAKQEADQKVQERLECKKQEAQCKKLREALKTLEEAHLEQQQHALQESIIKEEANIKREIKSEVPRSRKEEIRIRKEEEKAAREEARNRKEEARQKREEGMRVIRSELKRKLLEERQGSITKKKVTLLHKGLPAPLDLPEEVGLIRPSW
jgi:hypothetical protein